MICNLRMEKNDSFSINSHIVMYLLSEITGANINKELHIRICKLTNKMPS